jgi:hypothetical protein
MLRAKDAPVKERPDPEVRSGAERLDQIAGQSWTAEGCVVIEPNCGVEPCAVSSGLALMGEQGVDKGEAHVHRIKRRSALAANKIECRCESR